MGIMIGIGSTCSIPGDLDGNIAQIDYLCSRAAANKCRILLTPELSACGYGGYKEVLETAEIAGEGKIYNSLKDMAKHYNLCIAAGFVEKPGRYEKEYINEKKIFLSHYMIWPDGKFIVQRKNRVTPRENPLTSPVSLFFDETEDIGHVREGEEQLTFFEIDNMRCVIIICADNGIRGLNNILSRNKIDLVLLTVGAGGSRESRMTDKEINSGGIEKYIDLCNNEYFFPSGGLRDCIAFKRNLAVVNMCGYDGKELYHGGSGSIISRYGIIEGFLPGIENLDHQKPGFACGKVYPMEEGKDYDN